MKQKDINPPKIPKPESEYTLKLSAQQVNVILAALGEQPLKIVYGLAQSIHAQVAEQSK